DETRISEGRRGGMPKSPPRSWKAPGLATRPMPIGGQPWAEVLHATMVVSSIGLAVYLRPHDRPEVEAPGRRVNADRAPASTLASAARRPTVPRPITSRIRPFQPEFDRIIRHAIVLIDGPVR